MTRPWAWGFLVLFSLAACQMTGGLREGADSPYAPTGPAPLAKSVDGLIVGHRLMAAGQYELALSAYNRAAVQHGLTADVLSAMGSANLRLGRLSQAERQLRLAVRKDPKFPPAWNNLGVVLMERGKTAEAMRIFRTAYALDSGESDSIRDNLRLAIAKTQKIAYGGETTSDFRLVPRGGGEYLLLTGP